LILPIARPTSSFSSGGGLLIGYRAQRGNAFATMHYKTLFATCAPVKKKIEFDFY